MADFDSPWKEALDIYFQAFLLLFFPNIYDDIDWSRPVEMLDKEFQQLVPRAVQGRRTVDKLVKVHRKNGRAVWVLIHVEVQAQRDRTFGRRMSVYNSRIFDAHQHTWLASLSWWTMTPTGGPARTAAVCGAAQTH